MAAICDRIAGRRVPAMIGDRSFILRCFFWNQWRVALNEHLEAPCDPRC